MRESKATRRIRRQQRYRHWWRMKVEEPLHRLSQGNFRQYLVDRLIVRLRLRPMVEIEGRLTAAEAAALYRTAASLPPGCTVVEIGSWKGKGTYCLARGLPAGGKVIAIDPADDFMATMQRLGVADRVEPWPGQVGDFAGRVPEIDFLIIDGDRSQSGCESEFASYGPHLVSGGYLAMHDYWPDRGPDWGPNWVVHNRVLASGDYEPAGTYDSLWLARKK